MKASIRRQIEINKVKYRIKQIEKEDRRLQRLARPSSNADHVVIPIGTEMPCKWCDKTFIKVHGQQVYCNEDCRFRYYASQSIPEKWRKWKRERRLDPTNMSKFKSAIHPMERFIGECAICNTYFEKKNAVHKYCSKCGVKMRDSAFRRKIADKLLTDIAKDQVDG